ncbi:MAG: thioredoxin domain-containing protein [Kofleriaceae bacterium]|nr:thioredoxin domain-containing protein [Kofleriaceae bacterium]
MRSSLALLVVLTSCYRSAHDPELDQRLAKIEARLDAQDKAIADARSHSDSTELSLLARQIEDIKEQLADARVRAAQAAPTFAPPRRRTPDPASVYAIPVGTSPVEGSPKARVTMVMAFEFACPYCRRAWDTVDDLEKKYGKDLRVVFKQLVVHPQNATLMANASCAANRQHRFRPLAELLWTKAFDARDYDPANIEAIATEAGLDMRQYKADLATCQQEIQADQAMLNKLGVAATPTFFINGRVLQGAQPIEQFSTLIDEELAKAKAAEKRGVAPERYYDQEILGKGLSELAAP